MSHRFTAVISKEENWYVALCIGLGVVSQGQTIEDAKKISRKQSSFTSKASELMISLRVKKKLYFIHLRSS